MPEQSHYYVFIVVQISWYTDSMALCIECAEHCSLPSLRQALEEEVTILTDRLSKYDQELAVLRGENRRNMLLSVALLTFSALIYYALLY
ncbi:CC167 protein, partial [Amia calva]|nr:CC167 protein [Amia calva]